MKKSIILLLVVSLLSLTVFAAYPVKTVEIVCPWGAGGGTDRLARFFADQLQKELGEPFVVVNKTGGGGAVGHSAGAFARPDGYTVTLVTLEISLMHWMGLTTLNVDNFDYVIQLNQDASSVLVKADAPWQTVEELLEEIRKNPGKIKFSGSSAGSIWDLARIGMFNAVGIAPDAVIWVRLQLSACNCFSEQYSALPPLSRMEQFYRHEGRYKYRVFLQVSGEG